MLYLLAQTSQPDQPQAIGTFFAFVTLFKPLISAVLTALSIDIMGYISTAETGKEWKWNLTWARLALGTIAGLLTMLG